MASKKEVSDMVSKILRSYPQLKFSAESIIGFVEELSPKLDRFPGWLVLKAAEKFIETEIDFPKFNVASIISYCVRVNNDEATNLHNTYLNLKDRNNTDEKAWNELIAGYKRLGYHRGADEVKEEYAKIKYKKEHPPTPEQIEEAQRKMKEMGERLKMKAGQK